MNKYLIIIYLKLSDFFISNFFVNIYSIEYNNKNYDVYNNNKYYLFLFLKLIPFTLLKLILEYLNINIIYNFDNIYYKSNLLKNYHILPLILDIYITNNNNDIISLKHNIKYYSSIIPINFILYNNNINIQKYNYLYIKYFKHGDINEQKLFINEIYNDSLYQIFK